MSYDFDKGIIRESIQDGVKAIFSDTGKPNEIARSLPEDIDIAAISIETHIQAVRFAFRQLAARTLADINDQKSPESRADTKEMSDYAN